MDPFLVFPYTICAIIAGFILSCIIGRYIEGAISAIECALIAGIYLGLVLSVITLKFALAAVLLVVLILLLVFPVLQGKRACRRFDEEQMAKYRAAIESDPRNLAARERLGEALYRVGDLDGAIAEYSELVRMSPANNEQAIRLNRIIEERDRRKTPPIVCPGCGASNPPGRTRCYSCEGPLAVSGAIKQWLVHGGLKQICITWAIMMGVATIIIVALSAVALPGRILIALLLVVIVISAQLLYAWRHY